MRSIKLAAGLLMALFLLADHPVHAQKRQDPKHKKVVVRKVARKRVVYTRKTPSVRVVRTLPQSSLIVSYGSHRYYYHSGFFYRKGNGRYFVVRPPVGVRLRTLPAGYTRVLVGSRRFYYFGGIFYQSVPLEDSSVEYEVTEAPEGALVAEIPEEAEEVLIDRVVHYDYNGTLYRKVETEDGMFYEVSGHLED